MASPLLNEPRQRRSRETLERILSVTEELLGARTFEAITVQEIVERAGTSVGAFYSRFRDKDALLPLLYRRYDSDVGRRMAALERRKRGEREELSELVAWVVRQIVRLFARRKNLMRALALHVRQQPEQVDADTVARRRGQMALFARLLLLHRRAIRHPDPERAVDLLLFFVVSVVRERVLFAESTHAAALGAPLRELEREVTRMALSYLGVPALPSGKQARS